MNAPLTLPLGCNWNPVIPASQPGDPAWAVALLYPMQGAWTERDYLDLNTNKLVELSNGCLEFLPMPMPLHQFIVTYFYKLLDRFVEARGLGDVLFAPLAVRLWPGQMREPDVMYFRPGRIKDPREQPDGADLAVEVVSPGKEAREHDFVTKRAEYAQGGIPEYWIVDPEKLEVHVLVLDNGSYREHGIFKPGDTATSVLLAGFIVDVAALFQAGEAVK